MEKLLSHEEIIKLHGISVAYSQNVFYTLGAKNIKLNDFVISGVNKSYAGHICFEAFYNSMFIKRNKPYMLSGIMDCPIAIIPLKEKHILKEHLYESNDYYQNKDYQLSQIILPDMNFIYPWQRGYNSSFSPKQNLFFDFDSHDFNQLEIIKSERYNESFAQSFINNKFH
jgi:hypothetical protein